MIIVLGGVKGGSGKTTICTNLAVMRARAGKKVLLIDSDEQLSTTEWFYQRKNSIEDPKLICKPIRSKDLHKNCKDMLLELDLDDIFIDVGGRDTTTQRSAMCVADIFLTPFQPRSLDLWTLGSIEQLIKDVKTVNPSLKAYAVLNRADSAGTDNRDVCKILNESTSLTLLNPKIGQRKIFSNAASFGLGIIEMKKPDIKAEEEMKTLYKCLFNTKFIQEKHSGNKRKSK